MTLLVTIFLVLVNIFNTIQTNSPKAEGLTAIEAWVIACIIFVFGALSEYTVLLLKIKLEKCFPKHHHHHTRPRCVEKLSNFTYENNQQNQSLSCVDVIFIWKVKQFIVTLFAKLNQSLSWSR
jgi:hypothetical protein